jgi:hypothetical protein
LFEERPKTPVISWADRQTIFSLIGSRHRAIFERARLESRSMKMTDYQAMVENFDSAEYELEARARRSTA